MSNFYKIITTSTGGSDASIKVEKYVNDILTETTPMPYKTYTQVWKEFDGLFKIMYNGGSSPYNYQWVMEILGDVNEYNVGDIIHRMYNTAVNYTVTKKSIEIKYLIQDSTTTYTVENGELKDLGTLELTSSLFQEQGITSLPESAILISLSNPDVCAWSPESSPNIQAHVTATPTAQSVITENIDLTDPSITGIEKITAEYEGNPHIACSFDSGTTWKSYSNNEWVVLSEGDTGMTMTTFLEITSDEWNTVTSGLDGFMIRFSLSDVNDILTNIKIDFTN